MSRLLTALTHIPLFSGFLEVILDGFEGNGKVGMGVFICTGYDIH
jgi:hypothetical protein